MIIFPYDSEGFNKYNEKKLGKDRLKVLEKTLRKLGNFDKKKDIKIIKEEHVGILTWTYEVIDKEDTSFKFYNYSSGISNGDPNRHERNYDLIMKRKNSDLEYTYKLSCYDKKGSNKLYVIEIKYFLSKDKIFKIRCWKDPHINLIIEDKNKKYRLSISEKGRESLLSNLENIIVKASQIENLNLEQVLNLVEDKRLVTSASIYLDEEEKAAVYFHNQEIWSYEIKEPDKEVKVNISDDIKREVKREGYEPFQETVTENYEKIQEEVKRLMKQL